MAASSALLLYSAASDNPSDRLIVAGVVVCLVVLVVVRQILAFADNSLLVSRLDAGMSDLRASERRFRSLVQNSSDLITVTGPDGRLVYVSPGAHRVLGAGPETWIGRSAGELVHPDDMASVYAQYASIKDVPGGMTVYEGRFAHHDRQWRWFEVSMLNLLDDPAVGGIVGNARDITEERAFQQRLRHQAHHDSLTQLANRDLFHQRIGEALAAGQPERLCVLLIDLNEFKAVNDTLGHAAGDALLMVVAERMSARVRPGDTVARLGGDEFAVLAD